MTPELVEDWARSGSVETQAEIACNGGPVVQDVPRMVQRAQARVQR